MDEKYESDTEASIQERRLARELEVERWPLTSKAQQESGR